MTKEERKQKEIEKLQRYHRENRGEWWFYPFWKKVLYVIMSPFIMLWLAFCWCIMKIGAYLFIFGDMLSGFRWNGGNWSEDV